jgi:alkylation response protein AidB-like acyl-CoA dehydrogenase
MMDLRFSAAEHAFRDEVRAFLDEHLEERLRRAALATPGTFAAPELYREWMAILHKKGWLGFFPVTTSGARAIRSRAPGPTWRRCKLGRIGMATVIS